MPFDALHRDVRFLHCLLKEMTEKFIHGMDVEIAPATLEAPWAGALSPDRHAAGEERIKNDICRSAHASKILVLKCSRTALCVCLSLPGKDKRNQNAEISDDFSVLIQLTGFGSREGD